MVDLNKVEKIEKIEKRRSELMFFAVVVIVILTIFICAFLAFFDYIVGWLGFVYSSLIARVFFGLLIIGVILYLYSREKNQSELNMKLHRELARTIKVLERKLETESIFLCSGDGIRTIDTDYTITNQNKEMTQLCGVNKAEVVGKKCNELCPTSFCNTDKCPLRQVLSGAKRVEIELEITSIKGSTTPVSLLATVLEDDEGKVVGIIESFRDITERKRVEKALVNSNAELQSAYKELKAFSYSVSHDLRNPLWAIDGFAQVLLEKYSDVLDERGQHCLQRVRDGVQNMSQLIDDLLSLSHIGHRPMNKKAINLKTIAQDAYKALEDEHKDRKVNLTVHRHLPTFADHNLMQIVFTNLLSNALKFTRNRIIAEIEVGCEIKDKQTVFFVKDNGVGFDMKYADRLFAPFQRLHYVEEYEGTGIGLAIVQRIIDRHDGQIWVESKSDLGTTFYFILRGDK